MGWGDCGTDSNGRPIGYVFAATCDHPGCDEKIDRGLGYVCGDMHGEDEVSCEKYFCGRHMGNWVEHCGKMISVCNECASELLESGEWVDDEMEGLIRPIREDEVNYE